MSASPTVKMYCSPLNLFIFFFPGKRFAEIEMKLSLVKLLSEFAVEPCEKTETHIKFSNQTLLSIPKHRQIMLKFIPLLPKDSI